MTLFKFNPTDLTYTKVTGYFSTALVIYLICAWLITGFCIGYGFGLNKVQHDRIQVIFADSTKVTMPEWIDPKLIEGDSKVAKDLRFYYEQKIKEK